MVHAVLKLGISILQDLLIVLLISIQYVQKASLILITVIILIIINPLMCLCHVVLTHVVVMGLVLQ